MVDFGITVVNASSQIQIDSQYRNYSFVKQDIAYARDSGNWPWLVATFPSQPIPPLITFRPPSDRPTAVIGVTATNAYFVASRDAKAHVEYQVWQRGIVNAATWGMNVYNASGNAVYSSEDRHFNIKKVVTATMFQVSPGVWTVPQIVLASGPNDFVIMNKTGVEEQIGDGSPTAQAFYYRTGKLSASIFTVPSRRVNMATVFQSGSDTNTIVATFLVIGVKDTRVGRYRAWQFTSAPGGLADTDGKNHMDLIATRAILWGSESDGILRVGVFTKSTTPATSGVSLVTGVTHCISSTLLAVQNDLPGLGDSQIAHVWRSANRGVTWSRIDLTGQPSEHYLTAVEGLSATLALAGSRRYSLILGGNATPGIFRSTDSGQNWTRTATFDDIYWFARESSSVLYTGDFFGPPYKTNDYGQTWNITATTAVGFIDVNPLNASILIGLKTGAKLARSIDGGQTWIDVADFSSTANVTRAQTSIEKVFFADATYALAFTAPDGHIFRSFNAGSVWEYQPVYSLKYTNRNTSDIIDHLKFPKNVASRLLWVTTDGGGLYRPYAQ